MNIIEILKFIGNVHPKYQFEEKDDLIKLPFDNGEGWRNKEGRREGLWKSKHRKTNNIASIKNYKDGVLDGKLDTFYENGAIKSKATYVDGLREGPYYDFHKNGKKAYMFTYKNGIIDGPAKKWLDDGTINYEINQKGLLRQGIGKFYYPNGKLFKLVNFVDDYQDGPYEEYYENGKIKEIGHFTKFVEVIDARYNEDGSVQWKRDFSHMRVPDDREAAKKVLPDAVLKDKKQ